MQRAAFAQIAGVRVADDGLDQRRAADVLRHFPGRGLVDPHQRRFQHEAGVHADIERNLHRLDRVVAAIGIAGKIRLAHAADDALQAAPVGERGGKGQEDQVAARHERVGQAPCIGFDRDLARHRRLGDRAERGKIERVIVAEPFAPGRFQRRKLVAHDGALLQFSIAWRWP